MRFFATLPLIAAVSTLPYSVSGSGLDARTTQVVTTRALKAAQVLNKHRELQNFSDVDLGDLNLGDLDLCASPSGVGNIECSCDYTMADSAISFSLGCKTLEEECIEYDSDRQCGTANSTCTMELDLGAFAIDSFACTTCVNFTELPDGSPDVENACVTMNLNTKFEPGATDLNDVLESCSAIVNGEDCDCSPCENVFEGLEIDCTNTDLNVKSECAEMDFSPGAPANMTASSTSFMPKFVDQSQEASVSADVGASAASSVPAALPVFISVSVLALVSSFA